jgi:transmembrane sensor
MSQEKFWTLFSKKIAGEASPEELSELEALVHQHPEWQYALQNLEEIWKTNPPEENTEAEDAYLLHLQRMKEKNISFGREMLNPVVGLPKNRLRQRNLRLLYIAGSVAASLIIFFLVFWKASPEKEATLSALKEINEISTQAGSRSRIQLPDGSVVWLNAGSKLTYKKDFGIINREVELKGEAFFDVTRNEKSPFLIHTTSIDIKVLGTAFNVKAYPEDQTSETSLIRGRIEVFIKSRNNDKVILSPNEKLIVENNHPDTPDSVISEVHEPLMSINKLKYNPADSTVAEILWIDNKLVFTDESFTDLAVKMQRWYGVEIEINNPNLREKRFTGNFQNENIEQAMEALTYTTPFHFERKGNKIIIQ